MKRIMALVLSMLLLLPAVGACAESEALTFEDMTSLAWSFSSGAGGWSTDMQILEDGSFIGTYHDSEMGEMGDDYPYGTIYVCSFEGQMTLLEQVDEYSWKIRVDSLTLDDEPGQETIDDGIRFVTSELYGLSEGDEMTVYLPGTPVDMFTEDMRMWAHLFDVEEQPEAFEFWFMYSEANESGFVGYPAPENELELLRRKSAGNPLDSIQAVADQSILTAIQNQVANTYASDDVFKYIVRLTTATRNHPDLRQGASPRASVALASMARAVAWVQGRDYVIPADVQFIFTDTVAHRLLLTRQAEQEQKTARDICTSILQKTPAPRVK